MVALALVATSSAAVLSARRRAASSAFAAGSLAGLAEYFGSTKAKSAGLSVLATAGAEAGTLVVGIEAAGVEAAGADAIISFGAALVATGFTSADVAPCASLPWIFNVKPVATSATSPR